ncbi:uncharacterized protein BXZ73DRAFT_53317, partial [Epithele typhae]|uniref:uncharacterized protein n=1 Tax=Epithele typhae TaxID=378194 RepID=UPI002008084D
AAFFSYSQPSLNAVTGTTPADSYAPAPSFDWDTHPSAPYSPHSHSYSTSPHPAHSGPTSSLSTYPADYHSSRPLVSSRSSSFPYPAASSAPAAARSAYTPAHRTYSSLAPPTNLAPANVSSAHSSSRAIPHTHWDASSLYTMDPIDPVSSPVSTSGSTTASSPLSPPLTPPPIKEEDTADGGFIVEVFTPTEQPYGSPMAEVPLRATHAPPMMRKMMSSFRLENFAMHDGICSAATQPGSGGIEVGPLTEEPVELDPWQAYELDPTPAYYGHRHHSSKRHKSAHHTTGFEAASSRPAFYRAPSPAVSSHTSERSSPLVDLQYQPSVDDSWDGSSAYGSVADTTTSSSASIPSGASPTFAAAVTPAQSLSWVMRTGYTGEVDVDTAGHYRRQATQPSVQTSLSRVSHAPGQYMLGGGSRAPYQAAAASYAFESSGYSRTTTSGRYGDLYASDSQSTWYRESPLCAFSGCSFSDLRRRHRFLNNFALVSKLRSRCFEAVGDGLWPSRLDNIAATASWFNPGSARLEDFVVHAPSVSDPPP